MARTIREDLLTMIFAAQSGHPGGSLSATDIVTALYFHFMRIDPQNPRSLDQGPLHLVQGAYLPGLVFLPGGKRFFPCARSC